MKLNPKSEIRSPKEFRSPNSEGNGRTSAGAVRISDLRFAPAFTLIELILAIGVMAIALIVINAVFFSALRLREGTTQLVGESLPIERSLATLRRDLQGAMPPSIDGIFSGDFKVGNNVTSQGSGRPVDIEMFTTTGVLRDDEPWSEVQMVTYSLRQPDNRSVPGQDLYRSVTRNLLATMAQQPEDQYMMGGIERLEFSCCDGVNWLDTWDSTVTTNLPTAVRVRILLANTSSGGGTPRPIELVVPLDSQSHTNQN
jgi:type II secretion system protein J